MKRHLGVWPCGVLAEVRLQEGSDVECGAEHNHTLREYISPNNDWLREEEGIKE